MSAATVNLSTRTWRGARVGAERRFVADTEILTEKNTDFRRVLYTGHNLQLVLMATGAANMIPAIAARHAVFSTARMRFSPQNISENE